MAKSAKARAKHKKAQKSPQPPTHITLSGDALKWFERLATKYPRRAGRAGYDVVLYVRGHGIAFKASNMDGPKAEKAVRDAVTHAKPFEIDHPAPAVAPEPPAAVEAAQPVEAAGLPAGQTA